VDPLYKQPGIRKRSTRINLVIPASILETEPTGIQRALKVSRIARIASIFRIDKIIVYNWTSNRAYFHELCDLLKYAVRPPYLKKRMPLRKTLRYAGVMEPLNLWIHRVSKNVERHPIRLAQVIRKTGDEIILDAGLEKYFVLNQRAGRDRLSIGDIVLVRVDEKAGEAFPVESHDFYLGYRTECIWGPGDLFSIGRDGFSLGLSRLGRPLRDDLFSSLKRRKRVYIYVGGPRSDIFDIYKRVRFDRVVNINTSQGTETIRTEEAICIGLSRIAGGLD